MILSKMIIAALSESELPEKIPEDARIILYYEPKKFIPGSILIMKYLNRPKTYHLKEQLLKENITKDVILKYYSLANEIIMSQENKHYDSNRYVILTYLTLFNIRLSKTRKLELTKKNLTKKLPLIRNISPDYSLVYLLKCGLFNVRKL